MKLNADLVIMDWGIGGLSVYNEIRARLPHLSVVYYSDSGKAPYGKMSSQELKHRLQDVIGFFSSRGITHFVVACNAASTVLPALEHGFRRRGLKVTGVIARGVEIIRKSKFSDVGVIGGRRTILSKSYTLPFSSSRKNVRGRIAQPLSALIEKGELNTPVMVKTLQQILTPLKNCDALVLACTHYPAISGQIQKILPRTKLLDPAEATADFVKKTWQWKKKKGARGAVVFVTSGSVSQMKKSAHLAFQVKITQVHSSVQIGLDSAGK